jgi:ferrous iron transport protein A
MQPNLLSTMALADLKTGEHAALIEIHAEREIICRLSSLGFTPGVEIEMTQNYGHGPLLVTVRGARLALGRQEARGASVRRIEA